MRALIFRIAWPNAAAAPPGREPVAPIWCSFRWLQGTRPKVEMQISSLSQRGLNQPLERERERLGCDHCQHIRRSRVVLRQRPGPTSHISTKSHLHWFFFFFPPHIIINTRYHPPTHNWFSKGLLLLRYDVALSWITNRLIIEMSILSL